MIRSRKVDAPFYLAAAILGLHARPWEMLACLAPPDVGPHSAADIAAGVASTPYQYRVLVPWLVRSLGTLHIFPETTQPTAFIVLSVLSAVLLVIVLRRFVLLFIDDRVLASVAALSVHTLLPLLSFVTPYTPEDLPAVLLFTAGLICLHRRAGALLLVLFAVATLNRETSLLLAIVTITTGIGRVRPREVAAVATAQVLIWTVIQLYLWDRYASNPWLGYGVYESPMLVNASALVMLSNKALIAASTWVGVSVLALHWRRQLADRFLRGALVAVPLFALATLCTAFVRELRIYAEVAPILVTAGWVVLTHAVEQVALARAQGSRA